MDLRAGLKSLRMRPGVRRWDPPVPRLDRGAEMNPRPFRKAVIRNSGQWHDDCCGACQPLDLRNSPPSGCVSDIVRLEGGPMPQLLYDVRFALRSMAKRPGMSFLMVTTLAVGLAANGVIFNILD